MFSFDNIETELTDDAKTLFESVTENTVKDSLVRMYNTNLDFIDVTATVTLQEKRTFADFNSNNTTNGPTRQLQASDGGGSGGEGGTGAAAVGLLITMDLVVGVRTTIQFTQDFMQRDVRLAFSTEEMRTNYTQKLQDTANREFDPANRVEILIDGQRTMTVPLAEPGTPGDEPRGIGFYGPIGAGSAGGLLLIVAFWCWRRRKPREPMSDADGPMSFTPTEFDESLKPFDHRIESTIEVGDDNDISTLGDPQQLHNPLYTSSGAIDTSDSQSTPSQQGFDFTRAYGGAAETDSISSAPGRHSAENPAPFLPPGIHHNNNDIEPAYSSSDQSTISQANVSLFTDDESFERMYGKSEERIEVVAPAGKLGVVIDTPLSGNPMVHAIKDTSVLADKVNIGDRLVSVDGQDTTKMSAIKVSKLISSKAQTQRILVFTRTINEG